MKKSLLAILLAAAGVAHAELIDGNKLLSLMRGTPGEAGIALGYVAGAADAHTGVTNCPPDTATLGQRRDMVRKFLENNPEHRTVTADVIVGAVLQAAWPCKQKTNATSGINTI